MSFFLDFIGDVIANCMQDPEENKRVWDEHIRRVEAKAQKRQDTSD